MERNFYHDIFCSQRGHVFKIKQEMFVQLSFYRHRLFIINFSLSVSNEMIPLS